VWVYILVVLSRDASLRADLEHRVAAKQRTRSGKRTRLSFGYISLALLGDNCVQATVMHRSSSWLMRHKLRFAARALHSVSKFVTHVDISPQAHIGPGFYLYHGIGTVIGKGTRIGRGALVCHNVTSGGGPIIGDDVKLWAGANVIGAVRIGDRAEIGANGVVVKDVPADTIAVGVPAERFISKVKTLRD
jgi:serine acetyltransferase